MDLRRTTLAAITVVAVWTSASAFLGNGLESIINQMVEKIRSYRMTGNPDSDFANVIADHCQGAIDLSNAELSSGKNPAVKTIAKKVLASQQKLQAEVKKHAKKAKPHSSSGTPAQPVANQSPMEDNVKDILTDIEKWLKKTPMTGDTDKDYVAAMVQHFKDEVKIANMEIRHGKDQVVKDFATKAKSDSQSIEKEIVDLHNAHSK